MKGALLFSAPLVLLITSAAVLAQDSCQAPTPRPLKQETNAIKWKLCHHQRDCMRKAELDHIIPLSLCGAALLLANLQIQHCDGWDGPICLGGEAADKDKVEIAAAHWYWRGPHTSSRLAWARDRVVRWREGWPD